MRAELDDVEGCYPNISFFSRILAEAECLSQLTFNENSASLVPVHT